MKKRKTIRRVDEQALRAVLESCRETAAEIILRLAWETGLSPEEMHDLVWRDVDFEAGVICLPDRSVPAEAETMACLQARYAQPYSGRSEYVLLSDRRHVRMNRVYIFRCAKDALMRGGLEGVTLGTLRQEYILRQLEQHDKAYVARVAGITVATLDAAFLKNVEQPCPAPRRSEAASDGMDEARLARVLEEEGRSPVGLTLRLTCNQGLLMKEIAALVWKQIDFERGVIVLEDRQAVMDEALEDLLLKLLAERHPEDEDHVVLTPQSQRPFDGPRLSRAVKNVLIRAGLERVTLRELYLKRQCERKDAALMKLAQQQGFVTREDAMNLLHVSGRPAWDLLHRLVREEKLVRIGARYYWPGTAVPPEQHYEMVRDYLEEEGGAYRKELAELLRIEEKQCGWILSGLVAEGKLAREGQRYILPEDDVVHQLK